MAEMLLLFAIVFALNVIPAFAPPTWMALSFVGFNDPTINSTLVAFTGAAAATAGRLTLARLSRAVVPLLRERQQLHIDAVRRTLAHRRTLTASAVLFYAFTPLPSNFLFIAYGLTSLRLSVVALPFFLGRFVSYQFWTFSAAALGRHIELEATDAQAYAGAAFIVTQLACLALVYLFTVTDWRALLRRHASEDS
jgi:membrane protein DedA with SNARE-associated domain